MNVEWQQWLCISRLPLISPLHHGQEVPAVLGQHVCLARDGQAPGERVAAIGSIPLHTVTLGRFIPTQTGDRNTAYIRMSQFEPEMAASLTGMFHIGD